MSPPSSGAALIDPRFLYDPLLIDTLRQYAKAKPWQGTAEERIEKLQTFHAAMCEVCGVQVDLKFLFIRANATRGDSRYMRSINAIYLAKRISVVAYLRCFAIAGGESHLEATRWALNLFARVFPLSLSRCHFEGLTIRRHVA